MSPAAAMGVIALLVVGLLGRGRRPSVSTTWAELAASERAARLGIDNTIPAAVRPTLARTALLVIDPLRRALPGLQVTSAYRSPALNAATPGASARSKHVVGRAVDVAHPEYSPARIFQVAKRLHIPGRLLVEPKHLHIEV